MRKVCRGSGGPDTYVSIVGGRGLSSGPSLQHHAGRQVVLHGGDHAFADDPLGVFNGCFYTDPTTQKPTWKNYLPGSTVATDIVAFVIDGPDTVFEVNANAIFAVADIFKGFSISNESGNTLTGISYVQLDVANSGTDSTYLVQAIDISGDVLNSDVTVSNANVLVRINNHFYKAATSGL